MSVKLNTRQVGDVTVIDVSGRITLGEGSSALRDILRELTAKGDKKILLNLGDVSYIDSSGIGELVSGFTTVANQGGTLKLLSLTKRVKDLLQITKLYTVFDVHEDEAHAVRSFALDRRSGVLTAADKLNDLDFRAVIEGGRWPQFAFDDGAVVFDRHAFRLEAECPHDVEQCGLSGECAAFSVTNVECNLIFR